MKRIVDSFYVNTVWYVSHQKLSETSRWFIAIVFQLALEHAIGKVQENQVEKKLNGTPSASI
jgi:hypothetical protein